MEQGSLRIYLGAAPGVGKTYAMLNEGRRRQARRSDVVVGVVNTHGRPATAAQLGDLETVSPAACSDDGGRPAELDLAALLVRRPQIALVDQLAHRNPPGSRNPQRWQDVTELLDAGIDVVSTLNIGHIDSLSDLVERITGVPQAETVPDDMVARAAQVELVDATPEALRRRLAHGNIYSADALDPALTASFQPQKLAALRELTFQWMADQVDLPAVAPIDGQGREGGWDTRERIVVGISGAPGTERLIRRAARIAHRARGQLVGVHIRYNTQMADLGEEELSRQRDLLEELGGRYHELIAPDVGDAILSFARGEHATQIVLGATDRSRPTVFGKGSVVDQLLRAAGPIDVHVISPDRLGREDSRPSPTRSGPTPGTTARLRRMPGICVDAARRLGSPLSRSRRLAGWLMVVAGLPLVTAVLTQLRDKASLSSDLLIYLLLVVVTAAIGGVAPALAAAVAGTLLVNWFFTPPIHTWSIAHGADVLGLIVYMGTAATVSALVSVAERRRIQARHANAEAETLAAVAGGMIEADPLPGLMAHLRDACGLTGVSLLRNVDGDWITETAIDPAPRSPEEAQEIHDLGEGLVLALSGPRLEAHDRRVLTAFTANMAAALDRRQLYAQAAQASILAEANQLRSSLLQAVSHDLRTPLSSIKASVSSLRQPDIQWSPAEATEFLATIEDETDRLTTLVGNLLDMSRINALAVAPTLRPTALDAVVPAALASLGTKAKTVEADLAENTPAVKADSALLERVIANLVDNALTYAPDSPVRIDAGRVGDRVLLRIIDKGPGIPPSKRDRVFLSFQRLDDSARPNGTGLGLGLAVARGFSQAMEAILTIEDTPGGGTTMAINIPVAATEAYP